MSLRRESGREPTERVGPRRGREQKLGGHQALSLKSIAFWEAHLSGALSVTLAGRRVNRLTLCSGTLVPPPTPNRQHQSLVHILPAL